MLMMYNLCIIVNKVFWINLYREKCVCLKEKKMKLNDFWLGIFSFILYFNCIGWVYFFLNFLRFLWIIGFFLVMVSLLSLFGGGFGILNVIYS